MREITEQEINSFVGSKTIGELQELGTEMAKEQEYIASLIDTRDSNALTGLIFYLYQLLKQEHNAKNNIRNRS